MQAVNNVIQVPKKQVLTVDVEDYFHVSAFENAIDKADWKNLELRVEKNTYRLLELFEQKQAKCTFFTLDADKVLTATFTYNAFTITANSSGTGAGTVSSLEGNIDYIYPDKNTQDSIQILNGSFVELVASNSQPAIIESKSVKSAGRS